LTIGGEFDSMQSGKQRQANKSRKLTFGKCQFE